jgi:hypothetical protein
MLAQARVWRVALVMSRLTFYGDESGTTQENRVAVVAGYVGQVSEWRRFEREWSKVLRKYEIRIMHRANLETWHGEFTDADGWNPIRRKELLTELQPIIKSCTKVAIGSAVIKRDWEEVIPDWLKRFFGGVYGWCAHDCVVGVRKWCEGPNRGRARPITWAFEQGAEGQRQVSTMFAELSRFPELKAAFRIGTLAFPGKEVVPLQAADLLAYEIFKQVENQIVDRGEKHGVRMSVRHLMRPQDPTYLKYWDRARLREWLTTSEERRILKNIKRAWNEEATAGQ